MNYYKIRYYYLNNLIIILIRIVIVTLIFVFLKISISFPQDEHQNVLKKANDLYDNGKFNEVIELLIPNLTEDFSRTEKIEGYRLLAHAYFGLNQQDKAEQAIIDLLFIHYNYEPDPTKDRLKFIETLKNLKSQLPPPPKIPQILLEPIDFGTTKKGLKWSREFSKYLKRFFSHCDSIELIIKVDYQYELVYPHNYFILSGNGKEEDKVFVLDISLKEFYKWKEVWRDTVTATDQRGLADSVGVYVAGYFGYQTNFIGVKIPIKPFVLASGISALASVIFNKQAENEKVLYRDALTSKDATSSFNKLRAYEISRNSFGTLSSLFIAPIVYTKLNPRRPTFEKIERK